MPKTPATKVCSRGDECTNPTGAEQPLERFRRDATCADGHKTVCPSCENSAKRARRAVPTAEEAQSLLPWARDAERAVAEALAKYGGLAEAAESLGLTVTACRGALGELKRRAARAGWAPGADMDRPTAEGFHVKGVSTYYRVEKDGTKSVRGQWVKTKVDEEHRLEQLADAMQRLADPFRQKADPVKRPENLDEDLLCVVPFGDPHFGMFSWAQETGADFDLKIAEQDLYDAVDHLVDLAPPAKQCLVVSLGDLVHADNSSATTTKGTRVDVDTRQSKVVGIVIRAMRRCIDRALERFDHVTFVPVCGNHDEYTSLILGHCLHAYYEREPRVTVDVTPDPFKWYRFGSNLIGMCHGHTVKKEQLPGIMACDRKQDWAETEHRIWLTGHIHHETVKEFPGVVVESFRTLAPRDAWHHSSGYRSGQDLRLDVFHREHGRVNRHIIGVRQLRAKQASRS